MGDEEITDLVPLDLMTYARAQEEDAYVCTLDDASLKVAKEELFEDPRERLGQVEAFRDWILQQKYLTAPTDTIFLLKFLRTAKFSQLRAREIIENHLQAKVDYPEWLNDIDTHEPGIAEFLRTGYATAIPQKDEKGRMLWIVDEGAFTPDAKIFPIKTMLRAVFAMIYYNMMDEGTMVNGMIFLEDFTHMTMKHISFWGIDNMKKMTQLFEGKFPGRYKAFHYYNPGPVFEAMMEIMKPFLSQKMKDRFYVHGKNLESIYKEIPKHLLTDQYLPDDYKGPFQGTRQDIIENAIRKLRSPEVRQRILYETSSKWKIDKKFKDSNVPSESFRKLNID